MAATWLRTKRRLYGLARSGLQLIDKRDPSWRWALHIDFPPTERYPRYGHGRPSHGRIEAILQAHLATFRDELLALTSYRDDLLRIPVHQGPDSLVCWDNQYLPGVDTISLYGYLRRRRPARYIEVGSGFSTAVAHRARSDGELATHIVSVDPAPRAEIDALCDQLVRTPLELVDLALFRTLERGDVVFLDASHRVLMHSDVVTFFFDVLPELPDGVLVGVHDIFWPDDYPPEWSTFWYSEQYLLGAFLLAGSPLVRPVLASNYACQLPELAELLAPILDEPQLAGIDRRGLTFWFTVDRAAGGDDR
jgi:hypothetical protein